jgi:TonB family protein
MRNAIAVAAIALLPTLLHAQATSPASTQSSINTSSYEAKLTLPSEPGAATAAEFDSVPAATTPLRVSTGVTPPEVVSTVDVAADNDPMWKFTGADKTVVISLVVDKTGKPTNLKIAKSSGTALDENALASVAQYRFKPGMLNNEPTAVEVNLELIVHAPTR